MPSFVGEIASVGIKYPKVTDKDGNVHCEGPVLGCALQAASSDEHGLGDALSEMIGKRVIVEITLEQKRL